MCDICKKETNILFYYRTDTTKLICQECIKCESCGKTSFKHILKCEQETEIYYCRNCISQLKE